MTAPSTAATAPRQLGRFELRRLLGQGSQASVWLGFDPRLDREVAIKLLRVEAAGAADAAAHWLREARSVSRLKHPHIVPVFEADSVGNQPYLVFEYVAGQTLAEVLRERGPMTARDAAETMVAILDALQAAHAGGIVHRDLKPSNVLIDAERRVRVMDFGIAARLQDGGEQGVVGTPGYLSPEAADGHAPSPAMDVFSAGLVAAELLTGVPLVNERDPYRAIYRIAHEDLELPRSLAADADDALRALVMRALSRDPAQRHPTAAAFRDALRGWLAPKADAAAPAQPGSKGALEFLLRRMRHKSDFPALSDSVARIQRVANSENESLGGLSNEILKDVALTNKLLRLVNTATYRHAGAGTISTVSRAVALIGFAGIRNMALSLVLLEHMQDKGHAQQIREEFLRALMAGSIAHELSPTTRDSEEAFIGAMFHGLGRLLTAFYFAEEARQIRHRLAHLSAQGRAIDAEAEAGASIAVLGLSFEELGLGVARAWGFPDGLQACMRRPDGAPPAKFIEKASERQRWLAVASNEVTDALLQGDAKGVAAAAARYGKVIGADEKALETAVAAARTRLNEMARAMNLSPASGSPAARLLRGPAAVPESAPDSLSGTALKAVPAAALPGEGALTATPGTPVPAERAAEVLAAGIQDITNTMVENFRLNEVLKMILETMYRALEFRTVLFCLRDPKRNTLVGRFGLGDGIDGVKQVFEVALSPSQGVTPDLFTAVCLKGADTLIVDSKAPNIAPRLPRWFRDKVDAPAFLLLPLMLKGAPLALIYADRHERGGITLGEKELSLLRTLRNQAVMAFRQAT